MRATAANAINDSPPNSERFQRPGKRGTATPKKPGGQRSDQKAVRVIGTRIPNADELFQRGPIGPRKHARKTIPTVNQIRGMRFGRGRNRLRYVRLPVVIDAIGCDVAMILRAYGSNGRSDSGNRKKLPCAQSGKAAFCLIYSCDSHENESRRVTQPAADAATSFRRPRRCRPATRWPAKPAQARRWRSRA